ncbi:Mu-like prophage major head subunit gpT family protein [Bartonella sp. CB178]|uniref:apolipoprotein A-IV repeat region-like domain-containing protein n=1 Tax=Bartonella sp. CB178 TaxID=3112255 RepID=UPI00300DDDC1
MARRTKLKAFEIEVEEAFKKAMDFDFNRMAIETTSSNNSENVVNVDDLIQKISVAEEEILAENGTSEISSNIHDDAVIDESVVEQLFSKKTEREFLGGTVRDTLLSAQPSPANDDVTTALSFELPKQKSLSPIYWSTTALSALWAAGGVFISRRLAPAGLSSLSDIAVFFTSPTGLSVAAGTIIPILMAWGFAQLTKRSNELRNIAVLMTSAAQRLSEPQNMSEKQAIAIGQTIREEVAAMNEGIERTLGRAVELEAIIQGEVHNLEQAYAENESRIHTLIKELSNERIAILNHADRVQSAIKGTQEKLSDEFDLVTSKVVTNVKKLAQTLSQTLQKQGEDLVTKISHAGDGVTNQLVEKFNETTTQIQEKNTKFFNDLGKNFDDFSQRFDNNEKQIEKTFNETASKAEMHIAKIATHIHTATDQALYSVDEKFRALDEAVISRNNQSLENFNEKIMQLDEHASKLSLKFDNITSEAIGTFEARLANADLSLKKHSDSIIDSFIARSQALEDNAEKLSNFLEAHASRINVDLKERTASIADAFTDGHNSIRSAIDRSKETLREEIKTIDGAIVEIVQERSHDFKAQLSNQRDMIADMLGEEKDKIADMFKNQIDSLAQNTSNIEKTLIENTQIVDQCTGKHVADIVQHTDKLREVIAQSCGATTDALEAQARNIDIRADALRDSLAINSFSLNEVLADQARTLEQRMETIYDLIAKSDIHVDIALKKQIESVEQAIFANNKSITEAVQGHVKSLEDHAETVKSTLSQSNGMFFETLELQVGSFDESLKNRASKIFECAVTLEEALSERLGKICETIETQTSVFEEHSGTLQKSITLNNEQNQAAQQALEMSVENMRITLENSVDAVAENLHNEITKASDVLSSTSECIALSVAGIAEKAGDVISETGDRIVSNVQQTIYDTSDRVLSVLSEKTAHTLEAFATASHNAQILLDETIHTSTTAIEQVLSERCHVLHSSMQNLKNDLGYQLSDVSNRLEEAKKQTTIQISGHVEKLAELASQLNQAAQNTTDSVGDLTQKVSEQFTLSTQDAEQRIYAQNESFVNTLARTNSETLKTVAAMKENFVSDVSSVLEQLNQSIYNIHENSNILISAVQNVDGEFSKTASNFFHKTSQVAERLSASGQALNGNVNILQGLSQNTFEQVAHITSNFGQHVKTLSDLIHVFKQSENTLGVTIEEKHNALSALSGALVSKSDEINQLIGHYESVINSAFERTDKNARNSTNSLQKSLNQLINEASTRFSGAAEDIRRSADEIRSEISKISNDIDENVQKLPEKTKETTHAIRVALSEQIAALNDLTNVVQKSDQYNRNSDLAQMKISSPISDRKENIFPEFTKKIVPPKPILQREQSKKRQDKWVSNLLKRASREESLYEEKDEYTAFPPVQTEPNLENKPLNSLANDMLRAINHGAIVELWNHYQHGKANIAAERLYTLSGKKVFETVKKRYVGDMNFKRSVNQFVMDFEDLLRKVSRNFGDSRSVQKYLISDTGKVYTMLAHAIGRIQ